MKAEKLTERARIEVEVDIDVQYLAAQFAALTDDAQAQFFCFAAEILGPNAGTQAWFVGRHLMTCHCSTDAGRDFVREIVRTMDQVTELKEYETMAEAREEREERALIDQVADGMLP